MARFTIDYDDDGAYLRAERPGGLSDDIVPITESEATVLVAELAAYFGDHVRELTPATSDS
jgi:hypothetical protein